MKTQYPATSPVLQVGDALGNSSDIISSGIASGQMPNGGGYNSAAGGGLLSNIGDYMSDPNFMGGFSDMASGIGGLASAYFGYQQMKDQKKNNSLYRNIMSNQQNQANDFQNAANEVFGNTGRTDYQTRGSYA